MLTGHAAGWFAPAMAQPTQPNPETARRTEAERQARREREAAALRENLRRRKEQARARQDAPGAPPDLPPSPDVG